ncbi:HTH-type transcriptional repressor KstR2 [Myxococcaceae bacterium]|jgi:AcrR family transcriptional regulator|nr:HTH-type transcriptional repressor KstR2 [Myxococcaceae bacterium]
MPRPLRPAEVQAFRERLCDAAERLFAERGFAAMTLRELAAALGVSPMTPYRYFRNKEEIFETVRSACFRRFGIGIEQAVVGEPCPIRRIQRVGRAYVRFAEREPHAYRIMFHLEAGPTAMPEDPTQDEELGRGWLVLHRAVEEGVAQGFLRGDAPTLAHLAWVLMHGLVTLHLSGHLRLGRSLDDLLEPALENFLFGSAARPIPLPKQIGGSS